MNGLTSGIGEKKKLIIVINLFFLKGTICHYSVFLNKCCQYWKEIQI